MKKIFTNSAKYSQKTILVDDEDYDYLNQFAWSVVISGKRNYTPYAIRKTSRKKLIDGKRRTILMHREILGLKDPAVQVDHKDGNGLNNTRDNLRIANQSDNNANRQKVNKPTTSKYFGVSWHKKHKKWCAAIQRDKKCYHIGGFETQEAAALAYNEKAIEFHGEFAKLNKVTA